MESLQHTATRVLSTILDSQPLTAGKVAFAWQVAAGPALSRPTTVHWSESGTLRITARSAEWRREVERAQPLIAERLRHLLGPQAIRKISIGS